MWGRQAIDKMKYIPPFPMKKLFLIVLLLISSLSAFAKEQEEAPDEISVDEALKSRIGGPPQPSIKTTDLKELDEIQAKDLKYGDGRILGSMCTEAHPFAKEV